MDIPESNIDNIFKYLPIKTKILIDKKNNEKSKKLIMIAMNKINKIIYNYWKVYKFWNSNIYSEQYCYIYFRLYDNYRPKFIYKKFYPLRHRKNYVDLSYDKLRDYNLIDNITYTKLFKLSKNYKGTDTYFEMLKLLNVEQLNCIGW